MTRKEAFNDIREVWEQYIDITHPEYTTGDKQVADELLDDIERLISD